MRDLDSLLRAALQEDLGSAGDVTSQGVISADAHLACALRPRRRGIVAGLGPAARLFALMEPRPDCRVLVRDGAQVEAGDELLRVSGDARAILACERTALNLLCRLSAIADLTHRFVAAVAHTEAKIAATRKTTPGLRALEKAAVISGGGLPHRYGLFDAILIKDNHIAAAGGIGAALKRAQAAAGHMLKVQIEVDGLEQLRVVLEGPLPDAVLLDNMTPAVLEEAVKMVGKRMLTEASGGITLDTVADIAASGVDLISIGGLTHGVPAFDMGLDTITP